VSNPPPDPFPQTAAVLGADALATAGSVMSVQPGQVVPRLEATLRIRPNVEVVERVIEGCMRRQWQDELNETGSASMVIPNEVTDSTTINEGNIVVFADEGWTVFGWIVKEIERVQIARGEESEQVTTFSGVGLLGLLAEAVVYPPRGPDRVPFADERYFTWFSPDFEAQWFWPQATMLISYGETENSGTGWDDEQGKPLPYDWPDRDAEWIWSAGVNLDWAPEGTCYFAGEFTVPADVSHIIVYFAADDWGKLYFDGQHVGDTEWANEDTVALEFWTEVTPGEHYLGAKVDNAPPDPEWADLHLYNPAGMICSVYPSDGEEVTGPPLYRSHDGWRVCGYPASPPGMTPGMAMWHCIHEAIMRTTLEGLEISWNDVVDSDGNPWPIMGEISTKVGTDYLTFFKELAATYVDFWMEPASFTMHAWVKGMRGAHLDDVELYPVTDPTDPWSGNLAGLTFRRVN
jgi:hypothetical protein